MPCLTCEPIPGFHGYSVDKDGTVWSYLNGRWGLLDAPRALKGVECKLRYGHLKVTLCSGGRRIQKYVHDLVLLTLVGPCPEGQECLHDDGDPKNNRLDNLRWGTSLENFADLKRHGRHFTPFATGPSLDNDKVKEAERLHAAGWSTRQIANHLGSTKSTVWHAVAGKGVYAKET